MKTGMRKWLAGIVTAGVGLLLAGNANATFYLSAPAANTEYTGTVQIKSYKNPNADDRPDIYFCVTFQAAFTDSSGYDELGVPTTSRLAFFGLAPGLA